MTFLVGPCLALASAVAPPATADVGPVPIAGELSVEGQPSSAGSFPPLRLGKTSEPHTLRFRNTQVVPVTMGGVALEAPPATDSSAGSGESTVEAFSVVTDCPGAVLLPQASCEVAVTFAPLRPGLSQAMLRVYSDSRTRVLEQYLHGHGVLGLYQAGAFGEVLAHGDAKHYGDLSHVAIDSPILGMATTPSGEGYWIMEATGRLHPFGDALDLGSPRLPASEYAVALTATSSGRGYWLATQTGGVYAVGDAEFFGSAAGRLGDDVSIMDMDATPTGKGYWLVDEVGGVHAFGDARFVGSAASLPPRYPVTSLAATATGQGYWLMDALGGVFSYGDAAAFPPENAYSAYSLEYALQDAVISMEAAPYGQGFVYGRLQGSVGTRGLSFNSYTPGYGGGGQLHHGSFVVDLSLNVPMIHPSAEAGKVVHRGEPGLRAPEKMPPPALPPVPPAQPVVPVEPPQFL